jgi:hypothetical protein
MVRHSKTFFLMTTLVIFYAALTDATNPAITKLLPVPQPAEAEIPRNVVMVSTDRELLAAIQTAQQGTIILITPGDYAGGIFLKQVIGTAKAPILISGSDPVHHPLFLGKGEGVKLSSCAYVKLVGLTFRGFPNNGVHIDDGGGDENRPSHHILLEKLTVLDTGPQGNNDALKMSGVKDFIVRDCHFEGWGGSGIDLVGCQNGVIEGCQFIGVTGCRTKNAIQIKGGSSSILVQTSFFQNAGERGVMIGGATGPQFFRPQTADYEAKDIVVAGNRFVEGESQIAWVTSRDSHVHHNIFYLPGKWLGRIQQESKDQRFKPCQGGLFENNLIVADSRVTVFFGSSEGTDPASFTFRRNAWYIAGDRKKPDLPTRETDGVYEVYPHLAAAGTANMSIGSDDPRLQGVGPGAYVAWGAGKEFDDIRVPKTDQVWPPPPPRSGAKTASCMGCCSLAS